MGRAEPRRGLETMTPEERESAARTLSDAMRQPEEEPSLLNAGANGRGADSRLADSLSPQMGLGFDVEVVQTKPPGLADKFVVPPFSVLDTRQAYWQERRRAWMTLGLRGETTAESGYQDTKGNQADGTAVARAHASGEAGPPSANPETYNEAAKNSGGRKQGLVYQHDAPGSDPGFYTRKREVEKEVGRELTTAEFKADYYDRDQVLAEASDSVRTGTSVFDPVLCEVAYRWFSPVGGMVLDPFAGGAVRGVIAGALGRRYIGVELRSEQIADNREQANTIFGEGGVDFGREAPKPKWGEGDATRLGEYNLPQADLIFTCSPYADLEVYSDDPRDLSTMTYPQFREAFLMAMKGSAERLKDNRYSVWVIGEARGKDGFSYGMVADTVAAGHAAGLRLLNEAILVNSVGSAALRAQKIVRSGRKLVRVHQHVFVFVKGDPKKAAEACGTMDVDV